jgi:uncharacterized membrane protein (DUF373 family)
VAAHPSPEAERREPIAEPVDRVLGTAENVVYALAGVVLVAGSVAVLVAICYRLVKDISSGTVEAVTAALDGLLVVFILLELLAAVRATITERRLLAEPFLVVGIIASIKEIVVVALEAGDHLGESGEAFDHSMIVIGVLGVVVLLLSVATLLVRRKEREPAES